MYYRIIILYNSKKKASLSLLTLLSFWEIEMAEPKLVARRNVRFDAELDKKVDFVCDWRGKDFPEMVRRFFSEEYDKIQLAKKHGLERREGEKPARREEGAE